MGLMCNGVRCEVSVCGVMWKVLHHHQMIAVVSVSQVIRQCWSDR